MLYVGEWDSASAKVHFFYATAGNDRAAAPKHCAVPWAVFLRRVNTAGAGDGATGQQSG